MLNSFEAALQMKRQAEAAAVKSMTIDAKDTVTDLFTEAHRRSADRKVLKALLTKSLEDSNYTDCEVRGYALWPRVENGYLAAVERADGVLYIAPVVLTVEDRDGWAEPDYDWTVVGESCMIDDIEATRCAERRATALAEADGVQHA